MNVEYSNYIILALGSLQLPYRRKKSEYAYFASKKRIEDNASTNFFTFSDGSNA